MKRLRLYFNQNMYDPNDRVIKRILDKPKTIEFVRKNFSNGILMESIHTGNKRVFTYLTHTVVFGEERYIYVNHDLGVKLLLDINDRYYSSSV